MAKIPCTQTQHRTGRDNAHAKELADNRREIHKLTREVARLRRELEKKGPEPEEETTVTMAGVSMDPNSTDTFVKKTAKTACPSCGSKALPLRYDTPSGKSILICPDCQFRHKPL
jgi:DNA-directed RNA polymerase subunit RPC12/RpoP